MCPSCEVVCGCERVLGTTSVAVTPPNTHSESLPSSLGVGCGRTLGCLTWWCGVVLGSTVCCVHHQGEGSHSPDSYCAGPGGGGRCSGLGEGTCEGVTGSR